MLKPKLHTVSRNCQPRSQRRRGSALLIVSILLAVLTGLGVIFYIFAAQERKTAEFYSEAAKATEFDLSLDSIMDFGLEQLIVGPHPRYTNSALYGRRHSLLPNMLGLDNTGQRLDLTPHNGLPLTPTDPLYLSINDSPAANEGRSPNYQNLSNRDPDYTYPDANNVFLSYAGKDPTGRLVIIPSFHRPQNLRNFGASWFREEVSVNAVLRPHPYHRYTPPPGQQLGNPDRRFIQDDAEAISLFGPGSRAFSFQPHDVNSNGINDQGVWSNSDIYEYDVDNDGDGIREGIWLDLDFPPQETLDGRQYIPLFSMTVIDADALLNLNVHGNLARVWDGTMELSAQNAAYINTPDDPSVSSSNLGILPSEVNPIWALNRRPFNNNVQISEGTYPDDGFFVIPVPQSWHESANRELSLLLLGKYTANPTDLIPGRWGEESFLHSAIVNGAPRRSNAFAYDLFGSPLQYPWPGPGQTQVDDNGDILQVTGGSNGASFVPYGHPLDFLGLGRYYDGKFARYGTAGVCRWPTYSRYSTGNPAPTWIAMTDSLPNALFNDSAESIVDADNVRTEDAQFGADEMRALFLSSTDFNNAVGASSRLTSLAPFNLDAITPTFPTTPPPVGGSERSTQAFRSKFTTRSWDRKQFSLSESPERPWEFTADADNNNYLEFPPLFSGPRTEYGETDLFRPVTRLLLETEASNPSNTNMTSAPPSTIRRSMRLSINQLLVGPNGNPYPAVLPPPDPSSSRVPKFEIRYRQLTPHPDQGSLSAESVTTAIQNRYGASNVQNSYPPNGDFAGDLQLQEYWARRDRQLLARDIFSLLYTLGWPDNINPGPSPVQIRSTNSTIDPILLDGSADGLQNKAMIHEMAQFAVNLVDALDSDNIPTRFEFDGIPNDGWHLDDDPYTINTATEPDRREVWGVERLDLTLSEALIAQTEASTDGDYPYTQWNDTDAHHFCYVELRNPGPETVNFGNQAWRIEIGPDLSNVVNTPDSDLPKIKRLKLLSGTVPSGSLYTIGSVDRSPGGMRPSIMKISLTGAAASNWDSDTTTWIAPAQRPLDLDLKDAASAPRFNLTDATGGSVPTGALFEGGDTLEHLYVRLYRRASPDRPTPTTATQEADNPFVMVDQIYIDNLRTPTDNTSSTPASRLTLQRNSTQTQIQSHLANLKSVQTREPFFGPERTSRTETTSGNPAYANTLAADNRATLDANPPFFTRWQKVFDRPFASIGEVLQITTGGFHNVEELRRLASTTGPSPTIVVAGDAIAAENRFLKQSTGLANAAFSGRWYRLLEFLEVPSREHVGIPGLSAPLTFPRVPGKININTLRHPDVLAALIDDPRVMRLMVDEDTNFNGTLDTDEDLDNDGTVTSFDPPRLLRTDLPFLNDWWQQFLVARDGNRNGAAIEPDPGSGLFLPGVATARPFRSFASAIGKHNDAAQSYTKLEETILRSWPEDTINTDSMENNDPRQLFELGTLDEHRGTSASVARLDPYVRRRLLSKLLNNVTTRSNVFVVFMSVKNFRVSTASGSVRIGGPLSGNDSDDIHRGFFIIDRTQLEKAYDQSSNSFNFRSFIEFRQILN
ncbi:hypothetical protein [Schlesneria sp. DSM 10557]|uniref:hypothetical protein n=1 Tax=Schlesneria sp. DSM 10557 TaxID=3044399 RepID=UPI0035A150DE